jgi:DNA-binding MarR family transcriptional regulator
MTKEEESKELESWLELRMGDRRCILIYETLDGKSAIVTTLENVEHIQAVLLAAVVKLERAQKV